MSTIGIEAQYKIYHIFLMYVYISLNQDTSLLLNLEKGISVLRFDRRKSPWEMSEQAGTRHICPGALEMRSKYDAR